MLQHGRLAPAPQTGDVEFDFMFADGVQPRSDLLRSFESLRSRRSVPYGLYAGERYGPPPVGAAANPGARKWRVGGASDEQAPTFADLREAATAEGDVWGAASPPAVADVAVRKDTFTATARQAGSLKRALNSTRPAGQAGRVPQSAEHPTKAARAAASRLVSRAGAARNASASRPTARVQTRDVAHDSGRTDSTKQPSTKRVQWQAPPVPDPPLATPHTQQGRGASPYSQTAQVPTLRPHGDHEPPPREGPAAAVPRNGTAANRVVKQPAPPPPPASGHPSAVWGWQHEPEGRASASPGRGDSPPPANYNQPTLASRLKQQPLQKPRRQWQAQPREDGSPGQHRTRAPEAARDALRAAASPPRRELPAAGMRDGNPPTFSAAPAASGSSGPVAQSSRQQKLQALKIRRARAAVVAATVAAAAGGVAAEASDLVKIVGYADQAAAADAVWARSASTSPAKGPYGHRAVSPGRQRQPSPKREPHQHASPTAPAGPVPRSPEKATQTEPAGVGLRTELTDARQNAGGSTSPAAGGSAGQAATDVDDARDPADERHPGGDVAAGDTETSNRRPRVAELIRKFREAPGPQEEQHGGPQGAARADGDGGGGGTLDAEDTDLQEHPTDTLAAAVLKRSRLLLKERDVIQQRIQSALTRFGVGGPLTAPPRPKSDPVVPIDKARAATAPPAAGSPPPIPVGVPSAVAGGKVDGGEDEALDAALEALQRKRAAVGLGKDGPPADGLAIPTSSSSDDSASGASRARLMGALEPRAAASVADSGGGEAGGNDSGDALRARLQSVGPQRQAPWRERLRALLAQAGVDPGASPSIAATISSSIGVVTGVTAKGVSGSGVTASSVGDSTVVDGMTAPAWAAQPPPLLRQPDAPADPLEAWRQQRQQQQLGVASSTAPAAPVPLASAVSHRAVSRGPVSSVGELAAGLGNMEVVRRFDGTVGMPQAPGSSARSALADWLEQVSAAAAGRSSSAASGFLSTSMAAPLAVRLSGDASASAPALAAAPLPSAAAAAAAAAAGVSTGNEGTMGVDHAVPSVDELLSRLAQRFGLPHGNAPRSSSSSGSNSSGRDVAPQPGTNLHVTSLHGISSTGVATESTPADAIEAEGEAARPRAADAVAAANGVGQPPPSAALGVAPSGPAPGLQDLASPALMLPPPPILVPAAAAAEAVTDGDTEAELTLRPHRRSGVGAIAALTPAPAATTLAINRRLDDAFEEAASGARDGRSDALGMPGPVPSNPFRPAPMPELQLQGPGLGGVTTSSDPPVLLVMRPEGRAATPAAVAMLSTVPADAGATGSPSGSASPAADAVSEERLEGSDGAGSCDEPRLSGDEEWPGWLAALGIPRPVAVDSLPAAFRVSSDGGASSAASTVNLPGMDADGAAGDSGNGGSGGSEGGAEVRVSAAARAQFPEEVGGPPQRSDASDVRAHGASANGSRSSSDVGVPHWPDEPSGAAAQSHIPASGEGRDVTDASPSRARGGAIVPDGDSGLDTASDGIGIDDRSLGAEPTGEVQPWPIASMEPVFDESPARRPGRGLRVSSRASLRSSGELASSFASSGHGRFAAILQHTVTAALFADSPVSSADWGLVAPTIGGGGAAATARSSGAPSIASSPTSPLLTGPGGGDMRYGTTAALRVAAAGVSEDGGISAGSGLAASPGGTPRATSVSPGRLSPLGRPSAASAGASPDLGLRRAGTAVFAPALEALGAGGEDRSRKAPVDADVAQSGVAGSYAGGERSWLDGGRSSAAGSERAGANRREGLEGQTGGGGGGGAADGSGSGGCADDSVSSVSTVASEVYEEDFDEPSLTSSGSAPLAEGLRAALQPPSAAAALPPPHSHTAHSTLGQQQQAESAVAGRSAVPDQRHWAGAPGADHRAQTATAAAELNAPRPKAQHAAGPFGASRYAAAVAFTTADLSADVLLGASGMSGDGRAGSGSEDMSLESLNDVDLGLEPDPAVPAHLLGVGAGMSWERRSGLQAVRAQPDLMAGTEVSAPAAAAASQEGAQAAHQADAEGSSAPATSVSEDGSVPSVGRPMHTSLPFSLDLEELLFLGASQRAASGNVGDAEVLRSSAAAAAAMAAAAMAAGMVFAEPENLAFSTSGPAAAAAAEGSGGGGSGGLVFVVEDPLEALLLASGGGMPFGRRTPAVTITELSSGDEEGEETEPGSDERGGRDVDTDGRQQAQGPGSGSAAPAAEQRDTVQPSLGSSKSVSGDLESEVRGPSGSWRVPSLKDLVGPRSGGQAVQAASGLTRREWAEPHQGESSTPGAADSARGVRGGAGTAAEAQGSGGSGGSGSGGAALAGAASAAGAGRNAAQLAPGGGLVAANMRATEPLPLGDHAELGVTHREMGPLGGGGGASQSQLTHTGRSAASSPRAAHGIGRGAAAPGRLGGDFGRASGGRRQAGTTASVTSPRWQEAAPWAAAHEGAAPIPDPAAVVRPAVSIANAEERPALAASGDAGPGDGSATGGVDALTSTRAAWAVPAAGAPSGGSTPHSGLRGRLPPISPLGGHSPAPAPHAEASEALPEPQHAISRSLPGTQPGRVSGPAATSTAAQPSSGRDSLPPSLQQHSQEAPSAQQPQQSHTPQEHQPPGRPRTRRSLFSGEDHYCPPGDGGSGGRGDEAESEKGSDSDGGTGWGSGLGRREAAPDGNTSHPGREPSRAQGAQDQSAALGQHLGALARVPGGASAARQAGGGTSGGSMEDQSGEAGGAAHAGAAYMVARPHLSTDDVAVQQAQSLHLPPSAEQPHAAASFVSVPGLGPGHGHGGAPVAGGWLVAPGAASVAAASLPGQGNASGAVRGGAYHHPPPPARPPALQGSAPAPDRAQGLSGATMPASASHLAASYGAAFTSAEVRLAAPDAIGPASIPHGPERRQGYRPGADRAPSGFTGHSTDGPALASEHEVTQMGGAAPRSAPGVPQPWGQPLKPHAAAPLYAQGPYPTQPAPQAPPPYWPQGPAQQQAPPQRGSAAAPVGATAPAPPAVRGGGEEEDVIVAMLKSKMDACMDKLRSLERNLWSPPPGL